MSLENLTMMGMSLFTLMNLRARQMKWLCVSFEVKMDMAEQLMLYSSSKVWYYLITMQILI